MHVLRTTLWTLGAVLAAGFLVQRASRTSHPHLVQTTLDTVEAP